MGCTARVAPRCFLEAVLGSPLLAQGFSLGQRRPRTWHFQQAPGYPRMGSFCSSLGLAVLDLNPVYFTPYLRGLSQVL